MSDSLPPKKRRRKAPAFQEYASDTLANERFRVLSLAERGLLWSMRLQCWTNGAVPGDPTALARLLGADVTELKENLTGGVLAFFIESEDGRLVDDELRSQREGYESRNAQQVEAGKLGAEARWDHGDAEKDGTRRSDRHSVRNGVLRRDELSREERYIPATITTAEEIESYENAFGRVQQQSKEE